MLDNIPRLELVAEAVRYQLKNFDGSGMPNDSLKGEAVPIGGRILRVVTYLDSLEQSGISQNDVLLKMQGETSLFDPAIVAALKKTIAHADEGEIRDVSVNELAEGMALVGDITTHSGALLMVKGQALTAAVIERLSNFHKNGSIGKQVFVRMPV